MIYLAWGPLGPEPVQRFAGSYRRHPAGLEHRLVLVLKPPFDSGLGSTYSRLAAELSAETVHVGPAGLDLDSYAAAAAQVECETLCFLNTSSEILAAGWLGLLAAPLAGGAAGLTGCTGTWESALSAAPRPLKPFLRRHYERFPNPHVRTNAFMLQRSLMRTLRWAPTRRKREALLLESGRDGLTRQVLARRRAALVIGRDGRAYPPDEWPESRTFRSGGQENLLVADNRTRQYGDADPALRRRLAEMAWGDASSQPAPAPGASTRPYAPS